MITICEGCPLSGIQITEEQLADGWCRLVLDDRRREKLASEAFAGFDSAEARVSTDLDVHKQVTGRAIALCLKRHSDTVPDCPLTALSRYSSIDDPNFLVS